MGDGDGGWCTNPTGCGEVGREFSLGVVAGREFSLGVVGLAPGDPPPGLCLGLCLGPGVGPPGLGDTGPPAAGVIVYSLKSSTKSIFLALTAIAPGVSFEKFATVGSAAVCSSALAPSKKLCLHELLESGKWVDRARDKGACEPFRSFKLASLRFASLRFASLRFASLRSYASLRSRARVLT